MLKGILVPTILHLPVTDSTPACERFPRCRLHGHSIIDELPKRCPLRGASPVGALWAMERLAWSGVARFDLNGGALTEGLALRERCQVCGDCIARNLADPRIQRLRQVAGVS